MEAVIKKVIKSKSTEFVPCKLRVVNQDGDRFDAICKQSGNTANEVEFFSLASNLAERVKCLRSLYAVSNSLSWVTRLHVYREKMCGTSTRMPCGHHEKRKPANWLNLTS